MQKNKNKNKRQKSSPPRPSSVPPQTSAFVNSWGPETRQGKRTSSAKNAFLLEYPFFRTQLFAEPQLQLDQKHIPFEIEPRTQQQIYEADRIVCYGLYQITSFIEDGEIPGRYEALNIADWLIAHVSEWRKHIFGWPSQQDTPFYKIKSPRISARTHGLALSLLLRIAIIENDARYEETAKQIVRLFFLPVEEGGLVRQLKSGGLAFEEYPTPGPTLPLSSHLYSLIGLSEYANYFEDSDVITILRGGLRGLQELLPNYDTGKWLLFDLHPSKRYASGHEIRNICVLLKILGKLTEEKEYAATAQKWYAYTESFASKRSYFFHRLWEHVRLRFVAKKLGIDVKYLKVAPR